MQDRKRQDMKDYGLLDAKTPRRKEGTRALSLSVLSVFSVVIKYLIKHREHREHREGEGPCPFFAPWRLCV